MLKECLYVANSEVLELIATGDCGYRHYSKGIIYILGHQVQKQILMGREVHSNLSKQMTG